MKKTNKISKIKQSRTIEIDTEAKRLKSLGQKIYNFSAGESDLEPPKFVKESLDKAFIQGKTKYGAVVGEKSLREEICKKFKRDNNIIYKPENIVICNGCKQGLYNVFQSILNEGDEVIIFSPSWMSYGEQIRLAGGRVKTIELDDNFEPEIERVRGVICGKTKAIVLNSPNNPTGAVYSKEKLEELVRVLKDKDIYIICDNVYEKLIYDGEFYTIAQFMKDSLDRMIVVNSISKSYALPGLRVGYVAACREAIELVSKLQCQSTGNVCSIAQYVAEDVLRKGDDYIEKNNKVFREKRDLAGKILSKNDKISFVKPLGAFYYFINIKKIDSNSNRFCTKLLKEKRVATVPGIAFGMEGYVRISFASSEKDLKEGLRKFNEFCEKY